MSPPTFLVPAESLAHVQVGSIVILDKSVSHHIAVSRIQPDEVIDLVDGRGTRVTGVAPRPGEFVAQLFNREKSPELKITVAQALIKGDRMDRAIEMMTEVGAVGFIPWEADHSIVKWTAEKADRNRLKWEHLVQASVEQSRRSFQPVVHPLVNSKTLVSLFSEYDHVILMDESGGQPSESMATGRILLIVGPEGGLSESERSGYAQFHNVQTLTIGNSVLRGATAGVVGLTYLFTRSGEWETADSGPVER